MQFIKVFLLPETPVRSRHRFSITNTWSTSHVRMSLSRALAHTLRRGSTRQAAQLVVPKQANVAFHLRKQKRAAPSQAQSRSQRYPLEQYCCQDFHEQHESTLLAEATTATIGWLLPVSCHFSEKTLHHHVTTCARFADQCRLDQARRLQKWLCKDLREASCHKDD